MDFIVLEPAAANDPIYGQGTFSKPTSGVKATSCLSIELNDNTKKANFPCKACKGDHNLFCFATFEYMKPQERRKFVQDKKLCGNCLLSNNVVSVQSAQLWFKAHEIHSRPSKY